MVTSYYERELGHARQTTNDKRQTTNGDCRHLSQDKATPAGFSFKGGSHLLHVDDDARRGLYCHGDHDLIGRYRSRLHASPCPFGD